MTSITNNDSDAYTYKDENGLDVFTSEYLRNKKTCCKSTCLHCPYGHTLKTLGLEFMPVTKETMIKANQIIDPTYGVEGATESLANSLLSSAFGAPKKSNLITKFTIDKYLFIKLKGRECGVVKKGIAQLSQIYLKKHFEDQGLDLHMVDALFND